MISRSTIDLIYQAALIEDVIGEFVALKKSGKSYKGLSPFSSERTPSFYVVPTKGIYKDFSSGKGGNVVDFLMQHQKLTYPEALRWLAQKYNIPIEETEDSEQEKEEKSEREQLSRVVEYANGWFQEQLHQTDAGQNIGLTYFEQRGFRTETLTKWQLGFAPAGWDHLKKAAIAAGYNPQYLVKAGLLKEKESENNDPEKENQSEQNRTYDAFRDRVMFPIHSESGKVIAFAGRTLQADLKGAKYINSPESELFHKSDILYGLHLAKNTIVKENVCYLVEGYTDVISMHQAGVTNIVASCGTSLTEGHIKKIIRYTKNITVLFDGDAAGIKASLRSIEMILKQGMNVRVVLFPDGDDPDSFARKHDSDFIQEFLSKNATDFVRFKTNLLLEEAGKDPLKRAELIKDIILSISIIPDVIQREVYIQECSQLLNVSQESLMLQLNQTLRKQKVPAADLAQIQSIEPEKLQDQNSTIPIPEFYTYFQERDIVRLLLTYGDYEIPIFVVNENNEEIQTGVSLAEFIMTNIEQDQLQFEEPRYREIYRQYTQFIEELTYPELRHFTFHDNQEISQSVTDLIASKYEISKNWANHHIYIETEEKNLRKAALDAVNRLKLAKIKKLQDEIVLQIQEKAEQPDLIDQLLTDKIKLEMAKAKLADYFGSVIL
ncbi:MAG: primase [Bacteroidota bacterium]